MINDDYHIWKGFIDTKKFVVWKQRLTCAMITHVRATQGELFRSISSNKQFLPLNPISV